MSCRRHPLLQGVRMGMVDRVYRCVLSNEGECSCRPPAMVAPCSTRPEGSGLRRADARDGDWFPNTAVLPHTTHQGHMLGGNRTVGASPEGSNGQGGRIGGVLCGLAQQGEARVDV